MVVGGRGKRITADVWDPETMTFTRTGDSNEPRADHDAALLSGGRVLVIGGIGRRDSAEVWDAATGEWEIVGTLSDARYNYGHTQLLDGRVMVVGGNGIEGVLASAEIYAP